MLFQGVLFSGMVYYWGVDVAVQTQAVPVGCSAVLGAKALATTVGTPKGCSTLWMLDHDAVSQA